MSKTIIEIGGNTNTMIREKMKTLITELNEASDAYYNGRDEIMTNYEWDAKFDELRNLEMETGIVLPDSPTQKVGAKVSENNKLPKVKHEFVAKSLDKTKDVSQIVKQMKKGCETTAKDHRKAVTMMWKEDGGTMVVTYDNGFLVRFATHGDGEVGSDATIHAPFIKGLPLTIPYKGHVVIRGEVVMSYKEFYRVNAELEAAGEKTYKNPRNLATATIQLTDSNIVAARRLAFIAFKLEHIDDESQFPDLGTFSKRLNLIDKFAIATVERKVCSPDEIEKWANDPFFDPKLYEYPVDGLVIALEDYELAKVQPDTGHHPHVWNGYALKWKDETEDTTVRDIIWSDGRTGAFTPVVVFDPVELEGTTVTRASMHNLGLMIEKDIKIGDTIAVFKANKIIPQVAVNYDAKLVDVNAMSLVDLLARYNAPTRCPECGCNMRIIETENATLLTCPNSECSFKQIGNITHFCERGCMDIQGMSEATVEFLVRNEFVKNIYDLYLMTNEYDQVGFVSPMTPVDASENVIELSSFEGWGETSVKNMIDAIKSSKQTTFVKFLPALSIPMVGKGQAKMLAPEIIAWEESHSKGKSLFHSLVKMVESGFDFTSINGFGDVLAANLVSFIEDKFLAPACMNETTPEMRVLGELTFIDTKEDYVKEYNSDSGVAGKTFVITGSVNHYANRDALKAEIESLGGKVSGSVSKNTDYLINNDTESTSGKNKKAKELGVAIISEDDYRTLAGV